MPAGASLQKAFCSNFSLIALLLVEVLRARSGYNSEVSPNLSCFLCMVGKIYLVIGGPDICSNSNHQSHKSKCMLVEQAWALASSSELAANTSQTHNRIVLIVLNYSNNS